MFASVLAACLSVNNWSGQDVFNEGVYLAFHAADWAQTRQIARNPDRYYEVSPMGVLGKHPSTGEVDRWFAASAIGHIAISNCLSSDSRTIWQFGTTVVRARWVIHNDRIGLSIDF